MRTVRALQALVFDLLDWVIILFRQVWAFLGSAVVAGAIFFWEHYHGQSVKWQVIERLIYAGFMCSTFLAWREEHHKANAAKSTGAEVSNAVTVLVELLGVNERKLAAAIEDNEKLLRSIQATKEPGKGALSLELMRFEMLSPLDLEDKEEFPRYLDAGTQGFDIAAVWLRVESLDGARRAQDWRFSITDENGAPIPFRIEKKSWSTPKSWPRINYCALDDVKYNYIESNRLYDVKVNLAVKAITGMMNLRVTCVDRASGHVVEAIDSNE